MLDQSIFDKAVQDEFSKLAAENGGVFGARDPNAAGPGGKTKKDLGTSEKKPAPVAKPKAIGMPSEQKCASAGIDYPIFVAACYDEMAKIAAEQTPMASEQNKLKPVKKPGEAAGNYNEVKPGQSGPRKSPFGN